MSKKVFIAIIISLFILAGANYVRASNSQSLTMWMLNVGQGESVLVRTSSNQNILFDGGPDDSVLSEIGAIIPSWERTIDLVVLSHPHKDHITGLIAVLDRYTVKEVWTSGSPYNSDEYTIFEKLIQTKNIPQKFVDSTTSAVLGTAQIKVVHPSTGYVNKMPAQPHDANVSLFIQEAGTRFFLTGDLNTEHEEALLHDCPMPNCDFHADILQVPHHGSASGLEEAFLEKISPSAALIPVGAKNFFHHPRPEIISKLTNRSIPLFRTDTDGRIRVTTSESQCRIVAEKKEAITVPCGKSPPL